MNALRVSFLVATDVLMIALLVSLLAGCVTTPSQYRNGDFVSHMASTESASPGHPPIEPVALPNGLPTRERARI